jgi:guanylate kinase
MESEINGHLVLLMAPSGSGKKTLIDGLGDLQDRMYFAKTFTSRTRRTESEENPKYEFIALEEFEAMIKAEEFVEWANFSGNLYGTAKSEILDALQKPQVVFKEMELQGVQQIKKLVPDSKLTIIYIDAGNWEELQKRIVSRASITDGELELRRQRYEEEVTFKDEAEIIIANHNGMSEAAQANFKTVIAGIINSVEQ